MRRANQENRDLYETKRQNAIEIDEIKNKMDAQQEELDYYKSKCEKLEAENQSLRTGKGDNKRMRELENEIEMLKNQASSGNSGPQIAAPSQTRDVDLRDIKNDLSKDEQVRVQKELAQLDLIVKGYMDENQKAMKRL